MCCHNVSVLVWEKGPCFLWIQHWPSFRTSIWTHSHLPILLSDLLLAVPVFVLSQCYMKCRKFVCHQRSRGTIYSKGWPLQKSSFQWRKRDTQHQPLGNPIFLREHVGQRRSKPYLKFPDPQKASNVFIHMSCNGIWRKVAESAMFLRPAIHLSKIKKDTGLPLDERGPCLWL